MTITPSGQRFDLVQEVQRLNKKGIFDKAVNLDYATSINQFVNDSGEMLFNCRSNDIFSFKLNLRDIDDRDGKEFWENIGENEKNVIFKGFANKFYNLGIGELKGYISPMEYTEDNKRLLVGVSNKKVTRVINFNKTKEIAYDMLTKSQTPDKNKDKDKVNVREYFPLL